MCRSRPRCTITCMRPESPPLLPTLRQSLPSLTGPLWLSVSLSSGTGTHDCLQDTRQATPDSSGPARFPGTQDFSEICTRTSKTGFETRSKKGFHQLRSQLGNNQGKDFYYLKTTKNIKKEKSYRLRLSSHLIKTFLFNHQRWCLRTVLQDDTSH